jgi:hypothetical protein
LKLSNDPFFVEKVRDIVGLYLNPPDHAMVLAVEEKSPVGIRAASTESLAVWTDVVLR